MSERGGSVTVNRPLLDRSFTALTALQRGLVLLEHRDSVTGVLESGFVKRYFLDNGNNLENDF